MSEITKNPARCASTVYEYDKEGRTFFLKSCDAWRDISKIDHRALGIRRIDTGIFPVEISYKKEELVERIGERCSALCVSCPRFTPVTSTDTTNGYGEVTTEEGQVYLLRRDGSLSNSQVDDGMIIGVPDDPTARLLHSSGC